LVWAAVVAGESTGRRGSRSRLGAHLTFSFGATAFNVAGNEELLLGEPVGEPTQNDVGHGGRSLLSHPDATVAEERRRIKQVLLKRGLPHEFVEGALEEATRSGHVQAFVDGALDEAVHRVYHEASANGELVDLGEDRPKFKDHRPKFKDECGQCFVSGFKHGAAWRKNGTHMEPEKMQDSVKNELLEQVVAAEQPSRIQYVKPGEHPDDKPLTALGKQGRALLLQDLTECQKSRSLCTYLPMWRKPDETELKLAHPKYLSGPKKGQTLSGWRPIVEHYDHYGMGDVAKAIIPSQKARYCMMQAAGEPCAGKYSISGRFDDKNRDTVCEPETDPEKKKISPVKYDGTFSIARAADVGTATTVSGSFNLLLVATKLFITPFCWAVCKDYSRNDMVKNMRDIAQKKKDEDGNPIKFLGMSCEADFFPHLNPRFKTYTMGAKHWTQKLLTSHPGCQCSTEPLSGTKKCFPKGSHFTPLKKMMEHAEPTKTSRRRLAPPIQVNAVRRLLQHGDVGEDDSWFLKNPLKKIKEKVNGGAMGAIKKQLKNFVSKAMKKVRKYAPAPRAVDAIDGYPNKIIDSLFKKDFMGAVNSMIQIGYIFYHQTGLDVAKCIPDMWGASGTILLSSLRGQCSRFSAVTSPVNPTVWQRSNVHTTENTAPVAYVMHLQKCSGITRESWDSSKEALSGKFCRHKTVAGGDTSATCFDKCDPGFKPMCSARLTWIYTQCSTCCCKGGGGYTISIKTESLLPDEDSIRLKEGLEHQDTYALDTQKCALWFQIVETTVTTLVNSISKLDNILFWGGRCMKF